MKRTFLLSFLIAPALLAADLSSPETFSDTPGDPNSVVNAARLNNHVNGATILPTFISGKSSATPTGADLFVFDQVGTNSLKSGTLTSLLALAPGLTSVGLSMPTGFSVSGSPLTSNGAFAVTFSNETANTFLSGPASGSAATPTFRTLLPADFTPPSTAVSAVDLDWSTSNRFVKTIAGTTAFTFSNVRDGQVITLKVKQDGTGSRSFSFTSIHWPNNTTPVWSTAANHWDEVTFIADGSTVSGAAALNFQ